MTFLACVIPYFNGSDTIGRALDSVLQSPLCGEVVVVSDASPVPLRKYLSPSHLAFEASGRLKVIELVTNVGQGAARNVGASFCASPWLGFLDQDDEVLPDFYRRAFAALAGMPTTVAAIEARAEIVKEGRRLLDPTDPRYALIMDSVPWNVLVRRGAFWACGGFPTRSVFRTEVAGEDIAFKSALKASFQVQSMPIDGLRHHVRAGSATDRFLSRTVVSPSGHIVFNNRHVVEEDGSLAHALREHVLGAIENRTTLQRLLAQPA